MYDVATEFYINGQWLSEYAGIDLSARVRYSDGVRITRGWVDQQGSITPQTSSFTLNQRDGLFNNRNPSSPLFGKIGRNTRVRQGVKAADGTWDMYVRFQDIDDRYPGVYTSDKASLDITGDIDIRLEITPKTWRERQTLAGKWWTSGNQRSWVVQLFADGQIGLTISPDGTIASAFTYMSGAFTVDEAGGRQAIRITLDVNNGSGGHDVRWYTSDSITGTWTQRSSYTGAGATSIFSSTAFVEVGSANVGGTAFSASSLYVGKFHAFELRNGIGGTLVADFKPGPQEIGDTMWVDTVTSPNTWQMGDALARLASDRIRFCGELASVPHKWDVSSQDVYAPVSAYGVLRRLSTNASPIGSAIYRNYRLYPNLIGYWTMEDAPGATQAASAVGTGLAASITDCSFGTPVGLPGSSGAITMNSAPYASKIVLRTRSVSAAVTGVSTLLFYFKLSSLPAADVQFMRATGNSTAAELRFKVGPTGFVFELYNVAGDLLGSTPVTWGPLANPSQSWIGMAITMTQEGASTRFETTWHAVGTSTFYTHTVGGTLFTGTVRRWATATFDTFDAAFSGAQIAHVIMAMTDLDIVGSRFRDASNAYIGELAGRRMERLCTEEGLDFEWLGSLDDTEPVGAQSPGTLVENLSSAAEVDGGIPGEPRDKLGFKYVTRKALGGRRGVVLSHSDSHLSMPPDPVEDDRYTVNDVTITRPAGSSARYVVEEGPLSTQDPPDGVGRYERSFALNAADDARLEYLAQQRAFIGTWDETRIPTLAVGLHRDEITDDLAADLIAVDFGDPAMLTGLPAFMPPDDLLLAVFGYTEEFNQFLWSLTYNTVPGGPYQSRLLDTDEEPRLDATDTSLDGAISSSATAVAIKTPTTLRCYKWVDTAGYPDEFPFDVLLAGERVTVTAATAGSSSGGYWRQTLTVTRGVNGVSKAHTDGTDVRLFNPTYLAM